MGGAENHFGNWSNFAPMVAGWILVTAMFVMVIALIAIFTRKVMGWGGDNVDD